MHDHASRKTQILFSLLLIAGIILPGVQAAVIPGDEVTIFTAEEGAYAYGIIDSGNILISEIFPDSDGPGWVKLYRYNISRTDIVTLPAGNPDGINMDICADTIIWAEITEKNDFSGPEITLNIYPDREDIPMEIPDKFKSVSDLKLINGNVVITGRDSFMLNSGSGMSDIYIYYPDEKRLIHQEIPGRQGSISASGDYIVFQDDRYGQMKNTVHIMNLKNSVSWQIGDEKNGVFSSPDISGEKVVYRFDEDFGSFLKDEAPQQLLLTEITTNKTKIITSPGARISEPKIDGDNIVWSDKRNKDHYTIWLYNLNEEKEIPIADTSNKYPGTVEISKNTVMWSDFVDDRSTLKIMELSSPEALDGDSSHSKNNNKNSEEPDINEPDKYPDERKSGHSLGLPLLAVILGLCLIAKKQI
jgi:beta propeller repeat protein